MVAFTGNNAMDGILEPTNTHDQGTRQQDFHHKHSIVLISITVVSGLYGDGEHPLNIRSYHSHLELVIFSSRQVGIFFIFLLFRSSQ